MITLSQLAHLLQTRLASAPESKDVEVRCCTSCGETFEIDPELEGVRDASNPELGRFFVLGATKYCPKPLYFGTSISGYAKAVREELVQEVSNVYSKECAALARDRPMPPAPLDELQQWKEKLDALVSGTDKYVDDGFRNLVACQPQYEPYVAVEALNAKHDNRIWFMTMFKLKYEDLPPIQQVLQAEEKEKEQ